MNTKEKFFSTRNMVMMSLFAAVLCILAPFSLPIGPVPISLTSFVLFFSLYILGWKKGTITYIVYLLLGLAGLPVFSGFSGGIGKILGPTGGYLIGFIPMVIISGIIIEKFPKNIILCIVGMIVGTAIAYLFGTVWFCYSTKTAVIPALSLCVFPFIPGDLVKIIIAVFGGRTLAKQLTKKYN